MIDVLIIIIIIIIINTDRTRKKQYSKTEQVNKGRTAGKEKLRKQKPSEKSQDLH